MRRLKLFLLITALITAPLACALSARAAGADAERKRDNVSLSAVRIMAGEFDSAGVFRRRAAASGVLVSAEGHVLTARHAVFAGEGPADLYAEVWATLPDPRQEYAPPNRGVRLRFVAADPKTDLALFQIQTSPRAKARQQRYPFLRLASGAGLAYGDALRVLSYTGADSSQTPYVTVSVVELDERSDLIKVDGDTLEGEAGAAVVNERRELVGIQLGVAPQAVTLFDEEDAPAGRVELERVGMLRPAATIARFLGQAMRDAPARAADARLRVDALVLDERTRRPIEGATVGVLKNGAASPEFYVAADELLSYGRSDADGECVLSRELSPGRYVVKAVHPDYRTELAEVSVTQGAARLVIKMRPGPR